jgi:acetolactate synthase-1/2/3 large subunit
LWNPDFVKIAEAYGIPGIRVERKDEVISAIQEAMYYPGAFLLEFVVEPEEDVYPMVPPGLTLSKVMELPEAAQSKIGG